jgi:hypothetical protein
MIRAFRIASMFACALLLTIPALARMRRQGGEGGPPPYDRQAEVTITGTVIGPKPSRLRIGRSRRSCCSRWTAGNWGSS